MADVDDQWHKTIDGKKVRTDKFGKGKRWRARWRDETGRQRQQAFERKLDADRHVATVEADMLRKTYIDPNAGTVTFRDYAEAWRSRQIHREQTGDTVERQLRRHVYPVFGSRPIGSITPSDVQAWVRGMEVGRDGRTALMPRTVQTAFRFVSAIFTAAVADKKIAHSPAPKTIRRTMPMKYRVKPYALDQIEAMREAMPPRLRALIDVGAGCGLRHGEAIALEVDCVDFLRRQLTVRQQIISRRGAAYLAPLKSASSARVIPLAPRIVTALSIHIRDFPPAEVEIEDRTNPARPIVRKAKLLFVAPEGGPLLRTKFAGRVWVPARAMAELPPEFTFHDLRHFYASLLIRFGESVTAVQARLGHASATETLDTYSHLWPDSEDRSRQAIEAGFSGDVGAMWADGSGGASDLGRSG